MTSMRKSSSRPCGTRRVPCGGACTCFSVGSTLVDGNRADRDCSCLIATSVAQARCLAAVVGDSTRDSFLVGTVSRKGVRDNTANTGLPCNDVQLLQLNADAGDVSTSRIYAHTAGEVCSPNSSVAQTTEPCPPSTPCTVLASRKVDCIIFIQSLLCCTTPCIWVCRPFVCCYGVPEPSAAT